MANYNYPLTVNIQVNGNTDDKPNTSGPFLILVTTGTTQSAANTAMSGSSTSSSCYEITGNTGENRITIMSTSSTVYATVCAVRPGSTYSFSNGSRIYTSGYTFSAYCTVYNGKALMSRAASGSTYWTSHGAPYYKKNNLDVILTSNANKPFLTKGTTNASYMYVSPAYSSNQYIPVKYVGHQSSCRAGAISARTITTYSLVVTLNVAYGMSPYGTIEIYVTDQPNNYYSSQDSFQVYHSGQQIQGDGDVLNVTTDNIYIYLGINVDYAHSSRLYVYKDGTTIWSGNFNGTQQEIQLSISDVVYASGFNFQLSTY